MEEEDEEELKLANQWMIDEEEIRLLTTSLWGRKMRKRSGLLTTFSMEEEDEEKRSGLLNTPLPWRRKMRKRSGLLTTFSMEGVHEVEGLLTTSLWSRKMIRFVSHFSLWRRKMKKEIRFVNHFSSWRSE